MIDVKNKEALGPLYLWKSLNAKKIAEPSMTDTL